MDTSERYIPKALLGHLDKPFFIAVAPPFLFLSGVTLVAFATLVALDTGPGSTNVGGQPVSRLQYLAIFYPLMLSTGAVMIGGGYGLWDERSWARPLLTWGWLGLQFVTVMVMVFVTGAEFGAMVAGSAFSWAILALAFWYFYRYWPVKRYFERLEG
jgi:hypothetical protein